MAQGLSLRDALFLLAHDDGRPLIFIERIDAGLAAATLIEALQCGRVAVEGDRLVVAAAGPTGDPDTGALVEAIAGSTEPCGPRAWISWLADGAYERTARALMVAGLVRWEEARRLGGLLTVRRCIPVRPDDLIRVRARLRYVLAGQPPDPPTAALCGLVRVLGLESALLLNLPAPDLDAALQRAAETAAETVRAVLAAVADVIE